MHIIGNYNTVRRKLANLVYSKGHTKITRRGSREEKSGLTAKERRSGDSMTGGSVMFGTEEEGGAVVGS